MCEQIACLALESFESTQRLSIDAFESFWAPRVADAAAQIDAPEIPRDVTLAALLEHWTRAHDTAVYLCHKFGRLADGYAGDLTKATRVAAESDLPDAPVRFSEVEAPRAGKIVLANAA